MARRALDRLQREARTPLTPEGLAEIARDAQIVESGVGKQAGVGEKLVEMLHQARRLEQADRLSAAQVREAWLVLLINCESLRAIIDRIDVP